ncbi:type VI secretion system baseplate subunit TssK [Dyella subtropica]|uniref:type VI secretion system baseplate subunit TssK n=1 Tax=Dyella subtropica TaxID=2992127 RepID=UPI00224E55E9|nr:type VI secretion system baseplate subunit TssK [Dyella subtropica]
MNLLPDIPPLLPEAISWSEGMLLSPQHFQQNDIYWGRLLHHQLSVLQPWCWGVLEMALDNTELVKGKVVIERLRCVMPDGLLVEYPGYFAPQPLTLDLSKHDWNAAPKVLVQIRVPVRGKGAASKIGDLQRYTAEQGQLEADENTGGDDIEVDRLRPCIGLVAGDAIAKCYGAMPLLELQGDTRGVHLTDYHPPMLRMAACAFQGDSGLRSSLKQLSEAIWSKYRDLLGLRLADRGEARFAGDSNPQVLAAHQLVTGMPFFDVLLHADVTHPYDLYKALAQLVGFTAAIASAEPPPAMPAYLHEQCMPAFRQGLDYVNAQLARLHAGYSVIDFEQVGAAGFRCQLPSGIATDKLLIELRPRQGQNGGNLNQWLNNARTATEELIYLLVRRRYPGATVRAAGATTVAALNLRPGAYVYEVINGSIEVDTQTMRPLIVDGHTLVIMGEPDDNVPGGITLYLPRTRREQGA